MNLLRKTWVRFNSTNRKRQQTNDKWKFKEGLEWGEADAFS